MTKRLAWIGMFVGSSVGNAVPLLWGGSVFSMTGVLLALVGGIVGIWAGVRLARSL
jgi:hypothetical protein